MLAEFPIHPKNRADLEQIILSGAHGIIISGGAGYGLATIARQLAADMLRIPIQKVATHAYFQEIKPDGQAIPIESIRNLQQFLKLKVPSNEGVNRVVLIDSAHLMKTEAQNALLKTLEEPPAGTVIILCLQSSQSLLPTVRSRMHTIELLPISRAQANEYIDSQKLRSDKLDMAYALSQGEPQLLVTLLKEESHVLHQHIASAKELIAEPPARRLLRSEELSKDKDALRELLSGFGRIAHAALVNASNRDDIKAISRWHQIEEQVIHAQNALRKNANTKLLLDNLFLHI